MMPRCYLALLALAPAAVDAFVRIAGYSPATNVNDYLYIDLDQQTMVQLLEQNDPSDYAGTYSIYTQGGASRPIAAMTIPGAVASPNDLVTGTANDGRSIVGYVRNVAGDVVYVDYNNRNPEEFVLAGPPTCIVGGYPSSDQVTTGCFDISKGVTIGGTSYSPSAIDNSEAGRTLQGFSTQAGERLLECSGGCPYKLFVSYYDWYGVADYGNQFVLGALGTPANGYTASNVAYSNGHSLDFSDLTGTSEDVRRGRYELIEKGSMLLNVWMYTYRMLEIAVDQCVPNVIAKNDAAVRSWDGAVAFYTGSLEGCCGNLDAGVFPHNQADKRCENFKTCGPNGGERSGPARANYEAFRLLQSGQSRLLMGDCAPMQDVIDRIVSQMTIPLVQGTIRYAEIRTRTGSRAPVYPLKAKAEGTAFAASVVPQIAACPGSGADDAELIWSNMKWTSTSVDYKAVKAAFERNYKCLGITCAEVGGFWDATLQEYNADSEPCVDPTIDDQLLDNDGIIGLSIGCAFAALCCCFSFSYVWRLIGAEKQGHPIFTPLQDITAKPPPGTQMSGTASGVRPA